MAMQFGAENKLNDRMLAVIAVLIVHFMVGFLLLRGLDISVADVTTRTLKTFNVATDKPIDPPPPPRPLEKEKAAKQEGEASAANRQQMRAPVEAAKTKIKVNLPKHATAKNADKGKSDKAGSAKNEGPGSGAGGTGSGTGSGNTGNGAGGGGNGGDPGGGIASRARKISGSITNKDYPKAAARAKEGGEVTAHFTVGADGHASGCKVVKSSGNGELDATTCRLIEQRFRYEPARNKRGEAISDVTGWQQTWWLERGKRKVFRPEDDEPKPPPIYVPPEKGK